MHITLESDYAVRIVVYLAKWGCRCDANTIAQNTGVTLRFALKTLRNLVSGGMVRSFKGTQGGYELNRSPEDITLRDILELVGGKYVFSRCLESGDCTRPENTCCKAQRVFSDISKTVQEKLAAVTIADLL